MRETGNLTPSRQNAGRLGTKRTSALEEAVLEVDENPNISTRNLVHNLHMNSSLVHRILKQEKYHPYSYYTKVQALTRDDFPRRVNFCRWLQ
ncbi:hypothetical protein BDFB_003759 [Asbolus verrucosus]|uniref:HTH 24 domain containing protein n=1 Tax=Asbolus verrucosus TaxID=1661398 RepID=A0A482W0L6_ASBVE|nr:hypothetical protein BDFB_003759 [Asbolus verrucosus]